MLIRAATRMLLLTRQYGVHVVEPTARTHSPASSQWATSPWKKGARAPRLGGTLTLPDSTRGMCVNDNTKRHIAATRRALKGMLALIALLRREMGTVVVDVVMIRKPTGTFPFE